MELAQRTDRSEPAMTYINALEAQAATAGDTKKNRIAVRRLSAIQAVIETYSRTGKLDYGREIKQLDDVIWEFKAGDVRLYFYDRPGHSLVEAVRLTNGFHRPERRTNLMSPFARHPGKELHYAHLIHREDAGT